MSRFVRLIIVITAVLVIGVGCSSSTRSYRGDYLEDLVISKTVATPGEIITVSVVLGADHDPNLPRLTVEPSALINTTAGRLAHSLDAFQHEPIPDDPTKMTATERRPVYLKLPDIEQDVIVTAEKLDIKSVVIQVRE